MSFKIKKYLLLLPLFLIIGCGVLKSVGWGSPSPTDKMIEAVVDTKETLTVLSAVGGFCLLAGMVLLVISRGTVGWRPVIGGILLVLLNYVVAEYADWIFIPMIIASGCISAAWGWNIITSVYKEHKNV